MFSPVNSLFSAFQTRQLNAPAQAGESLGGALLTDRKGTAALEFALVGPVLLTILIGMFLCGIAVTNYMTLTTAANQGAQVLALSRGAAAPYSIAATAINGAAISLTTARITTTMTVNGTACTSSSCIISSGAAGHNAVVTLNYPCNLVIYGVNYGGSSCQISAQGAAIIQ